MSNQVRNQFAFLSRAAGSASRLVVMGLTAFIGLSFIPVASAEESSEDRAAMVEKYVDATHLQQESLRGVQMEIEVDAKLPRLAKQGSLKAMRTISRLGQITYKALGFSGDTTVKQEVIARYLAAESEARDSGAIAITPANYKFRYGGKIAQGGQTVYVFDLTPKKKRVGLFKGELWVDAATGMPIRESGEFVKNPSVFLKKIAFVRDYELQNGIAIPKHIASTVDTRLVGRAELQIAFSHFSKQTDETPAAEGASSDNTETNWDGNSQHQSGLDQSAADQANSDNVIDGAKLNNGAKNGRTTLEHPSDAALDEPSEAESQTGVAAPSH